MSVGADKKEALKEALLEAIAAEDLGAVTRLTAQGVGADEEVPFEAAIRVQDPAIALALIKAGGRKGLMEALQDNRDIAEKTVQAIETSEEMKEAFADILKLFDPAKAPGNVREYLLFLCNQPLGSWSKALASDAVEYCAGKTHQRYLRAFKHNGRHRERVVEDFSLQLRIQCEQFLGEASEEEKGAILKEIESTLAKVKKIAFPATGTYMPPTLLLKLVQGVSISENPVLIDVFAKYLSVRQAKGREQAAHKAITHFLHRNQPKNFSSIEKNVKTVQRLYRAKKRQKEEQHRIPEVYADLVDEQRPVDNFGSPYVPQQCSSALSKRIQQAASKIKFFTSIRHETKKSALTSIFDNSLFGRQTLHMFLLSYSPAALGECDILDGDANVICFGAGYGEIDPKSKGDVEITLDFNALVSGTHNAFFKQQDLGFGLDKMREVALNAEKKLSFSHTLTKARREDPAMKYMKLEYYDSQGKRSAGSAEVPKFELLSYDLKHIESVLILNFFRYLDALDDPAVVSKIYQDIEDMSDGELSAFLHTLGRNASDTMEFNFFGAHQIDFDAVISIKSKQSNDRLEMSSLVHDLAAGKVEPLFEAQSCFPSLFKSYRFVDYLSTKTDDPAVLTELARLRSDAAPPPSWYPINEKLQGAAALENPVEKSSKRPHK